MLKVIGNLVASFLILLAAFIPVYIYFFVRYFLGPAGFWQELVLLVVAFAALIGPLVWLLIICFGAITALWSGRA